MAVIIEKIGKDDQEFIAEIMRKNWGDETIAVHGELFRAEALDGIKAVVGNEIAGFLHYQVRGDECEILTLISLQENQGIGSALIAEAESIARASRCQRISLITTNDNLHALGFYQRRGFHLAALFPNQIEISRKLKPAIPEIGDNNIPLRDEIKLEKELF
jgi:ribosomal protein S18 acetylase RimI-like enzyme